MGNFRKHVLGISISVCLILVAGCGNNADPAKAGPLLNTPAPTLSRIVSPPTTDLWQKKWWVEKVARRLRAGQGLAPGDDLETLAKMAPEKVIDHFMSDPRFGDAVLDFNMYFLGGKLNDVWNAGGTEYSQSVYDFPHAIAAAKAVVSGGDYFNLVDLNQPIFMGQMGNPQPETPEDQNTDPDKLRDKYFLRIQKTVDDLLGIVNQNPTMDMPTFCKSFLSSLGGINIGNLGIPVNLQVYINIGNSWYSKLIFNCQKPEPAKMDLLAELNLIKTQNQKFYDLILGFLPRLYPQHSVADIRQINMDQFGIREKYTQFGLTQKLALVNSSTNYNRKRAAYMLKRYFCDDLTPINVENPVDHVQGKHGSDPACFACHYKLDPMAGYFKDIGVFFSDFSKANTIYFDDNAQIDKATYQQAWKDGAPAGHEWNIGYIRAVNKPELNDYGTNIDDLFALLRRAPEVKRCIVKRMFEYFVRKDQAIDGGYLNQLTDEFAANSKTDSAAAFRSTVKSLLLSNSFSQQNAVSTQCYDFPPGYNPQGAPPCQVSYILKNNCVTCHDNVANAPTDHLDLSKWIQLKDGTYNFVHLDDKGIQRTQKDTFERILDRLQSSDPTERMPLKKTMPSADREQLYLWVKNQVSQMKGLQ